MESIEEVEELVEASNGSFGGGPYMVEKILGIYVGKVGFFISLKTMLLLSLFRIICYSVKINFVRKDLGKTGVLFSFQLID